MKNRKIYLAISVLWVILICVCAWVFDAYTAVLFAGFSLIMAGVLRLIISEKAWPWARGRIFDAFFLMGAGIALAVFSPVAGPFML